MKKMKLMTAIIIFDCDTSNGDLILSDKGVSNVKKNEVVTWIIHPDSGVKSITAIPPKKGSPDVFTTGPSQLGTSRNWQGRIKNDIKVYTEEDYNIEWEDEAGNTYTFDPKLRVNV